jgi:nucleoside-diphosphate-sugar epimerase
VYGAFEPSTVKSHVVADFVWQALQKGEIRMLTSGEEKRQFVYIDDVCTAFHRALDLQLGGIYDVSSFEWVSVRRVADLIAELTGAKVIPGAKVGLTPITPMMGKIPGWNSRHTLEQGLARMVAEYRDYIATSATHSVAVR